jgi:NADPH:quinone reductase-like Zn-dependent oxidoreductase
MVNDLTRGNMMTRTMEVHPGTLMDFDKTRGLFEVLIEAYERERPCLRNCTRLFNDGEITLVVSTMDFPTDKNHSFLYVVTAKDVGWTWVWER